MPELFGVARWTGCTDFISCSYTCAHGVQPGVASFVVGELQLATMATYGNLLITDGVRALTLFDCKVSDIQHQGIGSDGGRTFNVSIFDRRWKWAFGTIDGSWNHRDEHGRIKETAQRGVRELAQDCFTAMGELTGKIGDLPEPNHEDRPEIDWVAANPAQCLSELADAFGCRVVFRPWLNDVILLKRGEGAELPALPYTSYTPAFDLPEKPSRITVVGGFIAYTAAFALEAVGVEPNGEIKKIDDLSYAPAGGFSAGTTSPPYFHNLTVADFNANPLLNIFLPGVKVGEMTRKEYEAIAKECVYKWYRPTLAPLDGSGKWSAPGLEGRELAFNDLSNTDYFRFLSGILTTRHDPDGNIVVNPPRVVGIYNEGAGNTWTNTAKDRVITEGFSIDSEKSLVKFDRYMFRLAAAGAAVESEITGNSVAIMPTVPASKCGQAELVLITSVNVRDTVTRQFEYARRWRDIGLKGFTKERIVRREELVYIQYAEFDPSTWAVRNVEDNNDQFERAADYYLDATEKEYEQIGSGSKTYPYVVDTDPDGALTQITWSVGGGAPCSTTISRNNEHAYWLPSYARQRGDAKLKIVVDLNAYPSSGFRRLVQRAIETRGKS